MRLTKKQEAFCQEFMKSRNQSEAYRKAYQPLDAKPSTIRRKASAVMKVEKVRKRLEELRAPALEEAQMTLTNHLIDLKEIRDIAIANNQFSAAVNAEIARGKAAGLYVEKKDIQGAIEIMWGGD